MSPDAPSPDLERLCREEFQAVRGCAYLNHAASSPLPRRSADVLVEYARQQTGRCDENRRAGDADDEELQSARTLAAHLMGVAADGVTFVPSTCDGLAMVANGLQWKAGDNVVVPRHEYPGLVFAWEQQRRRGLEVRFADGSPGATELEAVKRCVDERTRAVCLSHVNWRTGFRVDLEDIGAFCRERDVLCVVDAIQSLGALPIDAGSAQVDVVVAGFFKWLLGIPGLAVFYASPRALGRLLPDRAGRLSVPPSGFHSSTFTWRDDAHRFLVGTVCSAAVAVAESSLRLVLEFDPARVQRHTRELLDRVLEIEALGLRITSSLVERHRSSILSFTTGDSGGDAALVAHLLERGVVVSHRASGIRVAPHIYNTVADIEALLEGVRSWSAEHPRPAAARGSAGQGHSSPGANGKTPTSIAPEES
jgi:selenocysteine lyase/cysteine desulfurase